MHQVEPDYQKNAIKVSDHENGPKQNMKYEQLENNNYMMTMAMTDDDEVGDD